MNIQTKGTPRVSVAYEGQEEPSTQSIVGELLRFIVSGMAILMVLRVLFFIASF